MNSSQMTTRICTDEAGAKKERIWGVKVAPAQCTQWALKRFCRQRLIAVQGRYLKTHGSEREKERETETETEREGGRGERRASSWRIHRNPWNTHIFAFSKSNPESNRSLTRRLLRRWSKFQRKTYNHNATGRYVDASGLAEGATKKTTRTLDYVNRK